MHLTVYPSRGTWISMNETHEVMTAATWSTVRHALAVALHRPDGISQGQYDRAMTEVMGTSDKARW